MKRFWLPASLLVALVSALSLPAMAQTNPNLEIGLKPFGSYDENDFDSISMANQNLFLHIPWFSYPQRGSLQPKNYITYNGKNFSVFQWCNSIQQTCQSKWIWGSLGGHGPGPGVTTTTTNSIGFIDTVYREPSPDASDWWSVYTWDGAIHQMGYNINAAWYETLDGSGYRYTPNGQTGTIDVRERNGNLPAEDTNGNLMDTLGRTSGAPPTTDTTGCVGPLPMTASIATSPGYNGIDMQVKSCVGTGVINTSFNATNTDQYGNVDPINELHLTTQFLQTIIVYDGNSWTTSPKWAFTFDAGPSGDTSTHYGDLLTVTLPTGGTISYSWFTASLCGNGLIPVSRAVSSRTINANDGLGPLTTTYSYANGTNGTFQTIQTDPQGNDTVHVISLLGGSCSYYETETDYYQNSHTSGTLLKTVKTTFQYQPNPFDQIGDGTSTVTNVFPTQITTIWPNGTQSQVQKSYDAQLGTLAAAASHIDNASYGNVTEIREYDYGSGAPGPLLRRTDYTYLAFNNSSYLTAHMLDRVASQTVYNGSGTQVAQTTYGYDEYGLQATTTPQHTTPYYSVRGNKTSAKRWLNTTGGMLNTTITYYDTGMPYQTTDPRGNTTTLSYSSSYDGAYLTETQMPDTGSPAVHHITYGQYDYNTGLLTQFTDQNGQNSNYVYDPLRRMTSASFPDGGQTIFSYPSLTSFERQDKINSSTWKTAYTYFDQLGRAKQSQLTSDPQGTIFTDTAYDTLGRVYTVSNPYRSTSEPTYGITTYKYDSLGRTCVVTPPDGTPPTGSTCPSSQPVNSAFTVYSANTVTVTDQAGKSRKSVSDGLGRLTQVFEDPAGLNYETDYTYDTLDNLLTVNQKGGDPNSSNWRTRTFTYNSLSQLLIASNPESGTICYGTYSGSVCQGNGYDANGNLVTKTAPAPNQTGSATVTTTYTYDALNRLTYKSYSDTNTPAPTLPATFLYDEVQDWTTLKNSTGRLTTTYTGTPGVAITGTEYSYDPMGRPVLYAQCAPSNCGSNAYWTNYTYDLAGNMLSASNGVWTTISYKYDGAGRPSQVTSNYVDAQHPATLYTVDPSIGYFPNGSLRKATLANGLTESTMYNNRLQPCRIEINSAAGNFAACTDGALPGNVLDFTYGYNSGSANNGNVASWSAVGNQTFSRSYTYDSLNRLWTLSDTASAQPCKGLSWTYDSWGNRTDQTVDRRNLQHFPPGRQHPEPPARRSLSIRHRWQHDQ